MPGLTLLVLIFKSVSVKSGLRHPDAVVETSSLSSVLPPDVTYCCTIPEEVIDTGQISALQLESIVYACQRHETILPSGDRAGYLVGDGAGVGKGRIISGIIYEYLLGRKRALWFSVSSDLIFDAKRDLGDIGASKIKVWPFTRFGYSKLSGKVNRCKKGVIFATYSGLIGESHSASKGKNKTRLKQLVNWCGKDFDGLIVFDECHRAKNLMPGSGAKPSKTGHTVVELQRMLPKARVVYANATGKDQRDLMDYDGRISAHVRADRERL